jgi:tetratricopeptide (TPR) repeat protein
MQMGKQSEVGFETTRKYLHRILRNQGVHDPEVASFFSQFKLFKQAGANKGTILTAIESQLANLTGGNGRYGDLLRRRFWDGDTTRKVALHFHLSTDQVNRLQRDAIDALSQLILNEEEEIKQADAQRLLGRLPVQNYSSIFGVKSIQQKLLPILIEQREPWVITICGIGGIGKTAVVDFLIRSAITDLPFSDILWIRVPSEKSARSLTDYVIQALARQLLPEPSPVSDQLRQIRNVLKKMAHLIVVDNIEEGLESGEFIESLKSLVNPTRILLTSRNLPLETSEFFIALVPELGIEDSGLLLNYQMQITGLNEDIRPHIETIYRLAGGNPLALKLVAGLLHTWSLTDALAAMQHGRGKQPRELFNTVFQKAWNALSERSKVILETMIFAGNEGINPDQIASITYFSLDDIRQGIRDLALRSLVERRGPLDGNNYGIHPLTNTFLQNQINSSSTETRETINRFTTSNIRYWIERVRASKVHDVFQLNADNLRMAIDLAFEFDENIDAIRLLSKLHSSILSNRLASRWIDLFSRGLEILKSMDKSELEFELSLALGSLYWQVGQHDKATESFQLANDMAKAHNWVDNVVSSQLAISITLWSQRNYKEASRIAREARKLIKRTSKHPLEGRLLTVLGIIAFTQKRYPTAIRNFSKAAKYFKHGEPAIYVQLLLNRGVALQMEKQFSVALKQYRRAETVLISHPHSDQDKVLIELLRSSAFYQKGDLANAKASLKRASVIGAHWADANSRAFFESSLGRIYFDLGDKGKASKFFRSAAQLWKKTQNPEIEPDISLLFMIEPETI